MLAQFDDFLADPQKWPKTIWGLLGRPRKMTPAARRWGATEAGLWWLEKRHYTDVTKLELQRHYRQHVAIVETSLVAYAQAATGENPPTGPDALLQFYEKGIQLGLRSFEAISNRIDMMEAAGEEVPLEILYPIAMMGARMATSAASLSKRNPLELPPQGNSGFRRNPPSQRMGHSRIRVIDGEAQPVHDEGPADREDYNARAAMEGQNPI